VESEEQSSGALLDVCESGSAARLGNCCACLILPAPEVNASKTGAAQNFAGLVNGSAISGHSVMRRYLALLFLLLMRGAEIRKFIESVRVRF
jgi:hypothetical protein